MAGRRLQIRVIGGAAVAVAVLCALSAGHAVAGQEDADSVKVLLIGVAPENGQVLQTGLRALQTFRVEPELAATDDVDGWRDVTGDRRVANAGDGPWSDPGDDDVVLVLAPDALQLTSTSGENGAATPSDSQSCAARLAWRDVRSTTRALGVQATPNVHLACTVEEFEAAIQAIEVEHAVPVVDAGDVTFDADGHASIKVTGPATELPPDALQLSSASLPGVADVEVDVDGWNVVLDVKPGTEEIEAAPKAELQLVLASSVAEVAQLEPYEISIAPWQAEGTGGSNRTFLLVGLVAIAAALGAGSFLTMRARAAGGGDVVMDPPPGGEGKAGTDRIPDRAGPDEGEELPPPPTPPAVRPAPPPQPAPRKASVVGLWPMDEVEGGEVPRTKVRWILPERIRERARVWIHPDQLAFGVFSEKVEQRGEDADPVLMTSSVDRGIRLLGVFDGMGGAGSGKVTCTDGVDRTQAYLASRLVRDALTEWASSVFDGNQLDVADLHARIEHVLQDRRDEWQLEGRSTLKGGLRRTLPTTMAVALIDAPPKRDAVVSAYWAGDSRAYVLTPTAGLQQLTADHTRERDVLAQLTDDPPITNVSASQTFTIEQTSVQLSEPFVAICATDGVFGYVQTPGEVEFHVLDTLEAASDPRDWSTRLLQRVLGYTADDATIALSAVGFSSFRQLRAASRPRTEHVRETQVAPFASVPPGDQDALRSARLTAWNEYRETYTSLMPTTAPPPRGR